MYILRACHNQPDHSLSYSSIYTLFESTSLCFSGESIDVLGPMAEAVFLVSGVDTAIWTFKLALSYFLNQRVPSMNSPWHCCNRSLADT